MLDTEPMAMTVGPGVQSLQRPFTSAAEVEACREPLSDHLPLLLEHPALPGIDALVTWNLMTRMAVRGERTNNGWGRTEDEAEYVARLRRLGKELAAIVAALPQRTAVALQELPSSAEHRALLLAPIHDDGNTSWTFSETRRSRPNGFSQGMLFRAGFWNVSEHTPRHRFSLQANRIQVLRLDVPDGSGSAIIANVHLLWGTGHEPDLEHLLEENAGTPIAILGDFNRALPPGRMTLAGRAAEVFFPTVPTSVIHTEAGARFGINDGFIVVA